jgi:glycosyltransferase involved in cell wall biosynthesis
MKIGYFLGSAGLSGGGIGPYAWRVLDLLLTNCKDSDIRILVLCTKETHKECFVLVNKYQAHDKVTVCLVPDSFSLVNRFNRVIGAVAARVLNKMRIQNRLDLLLSPSYRWFASLNIDLLHVPYQTPPLYDLPYPFIVTMHDVQELHYPEYFTPEERAWRAEWFWKSLHNASGVIVSFGHVKQDLRKFFYLPDPKVFVCPLPYDHIRLDDPRDRDLSKYAAKYDVFGDFILYPAQTWQHKNHLTLIKAIELLRSRYDRSVHLICTGKQNSFFDDVIEGHLTNSSVSRQIHFMGVVPEGELCWLYKNCALVVIPTLYEAGSFPLLEAMRLSAPVICSSVTSLPETIGDSRFIFDPLDMAGMSRLILEMLGSLELRQANIRNSRARINQLSQVDSFKSIYTTWRNTLGVY